MKTVWKYTLLIEDEQTITVPRGSEILHVANQFADYQNQIEIWLRVPVADDVEMVQRRIRIAGTGHPVADWPHVGTVITLNGQLVWHVFDGGEIE